MMTTTLIDILETFISEIDESHLITYEPWIHVVDKIEQLVEILEAIVT